MPDIKLAGGRSPVSARSKIPRAATGESQHKMVGHDAEYYRNDTKRWTPLRWKEEHEAIENERRLDEYRRNRARYEMGYRV